jgi:hypothetical protein
MSPISLRPDYSSRPANSSAVRPLIRSAIVEVRVGPQAAANEARRLWPNDRATHELIERGGVVPTATTTSNVPTSTIVASLVPLLGPVSAAGAILARCLNLSFGEAAAINVPGIIPSASGVSFIGQGGPFPIKQLSFSTAGPLTPKKLALGTVLTRELFEGSSAEAVIAAVLAADLSLGIEAILFDAAAADTVRPAGLKNGVTALTADAGTGVDAMFNDMATLGAAVAAVAGLNYCYVMSPRQAIKAQLRKSQNEFPFPVYASAALADKCVCALGFTALAVAGDTAPRIELSRQAAVHMEQDNPLQISTSGTPNVVASPVQSLFQQDLIGVRLITDISWALRGTGTTAGFAWINTVNW